MTKLFTSYFHTAQKWSLTLNKDRNCYWKNVVEIVRRNHLRSRWLLVATKESPLSFPKAGFPLAFVFWHGLLPHRKSATQNCVLQNLFDLFERFFWNQLHAVLQKFCFATRQLWKCHCNYHAIPVPFDFAWKLHPALSPQNKRLCVATAAAGKIFCSVTSAEFFSAMASHKMGSWLQRLRRVANELGGGEAFNLRKEFCISIFSNNWALSGAKCRKHYSRFSDIPNSCTIFFPVCLVLFKDRQPKSSLNQSCFELPRLLFYWFSGKRACNQRWENCNG